MFSLQRAETYVFHIRLTFNSGSSWQLHIRLTFNSGSSWQLHIATHNYITIHYFELPMPCTSEQSNTIPIQFVNSYLWPQ